MSIFTNPKQEAVIKPEKTKAQLQVELNNEILMLAKQNYNQLCSMQKRSTRLIWYNDKLTPQQACDALGTNAAKLFIAHGALTRAIAAAAQADNVTPDILLPSNDMQINSDGTVTVLEGPYVLE